MSIQFFDEQLLLFINQKTANAAFDMLMPALSQRGYLLIIPFLLAMLLRAANRKNDRGTTFLAAALWTLLISCCAVYLAEFAEYWMKETVARVRPCRVIEGLRLILPCPASFSMPSGHASSSFAFAVPLFYLTRKYIALIWRLYPLVLAAMVAFSRIYLGVHYPTDVLAGALLGSMIGLCLSILYQAVVTEEFMKQKKISR
jgi:undecaprenyl-diphosphatase